MGEIRWSAVLVIAATQMLASTTLGCSGGHEPGEPTEGTERSSDALAAGSEGGGSCRLYTPYSQTDGSWIGWHWDDGNRYGDYCYGFIKDSAGCHSRHASC